MLSIFQVYSLNVYICVGIGLTGNLLLLWLIHRHTQPEMRAFSLILLQTCLCDIFTMFEQTLIQPMICAGDGGVPAAVLVGPLASDWAYPWNVVAIFWIWSLFALLCKQQFLTHFLYRWLLITRSYKMRVWIFTLVLFTPSVLINVLVTMEADFVAIAERRGLSSASATLVGLSPAQIQNPMVNANSDYSRVDETLRICFDLISFFGVLFFAFTTSGFVRKNLHGPTAARDRDLHRQLTRTLILQMLLAFATSYLPSVVLQMVLLFPSISISPAVGLWLMTMLPSLLFWILALNPLVTMLIIKSYRLALWKALVKCYHYSISVFASSPAMPTTVAISMAKALNARDITMADQPKMLVSAVNNNNKNNGDQTTIRTKEKDNNRLHQIEAGNSSSGNHARIPMANFSAMNNNNIGKKTPVIASSSRVYPE